MLGHLLCRGGDASAVVMLAQELERSGRAGDATLLCASQLGWSGEPARGVDALLSLISRTPAEPTAWSVAADPFYAPLRVAPAFVRLLDAVAARAA
jgi:hypothetical protein